MCGTINKQVCDHSLKAIRLTEFMMNKGSYGIASLYLSLIDSSEQVDGLPAHYQLAGELKQTGEPCWMSDVQQTLCFCITCASHMMWMIQVLFTWIY